jgi:hypothetical protein
MSMFGRNNSDQCFSGSTGIAIVLGSSGVADAEGKFSLALADSRGVATPSTGCSLTSGSANNGCTAAQAYQDGGGPLSLLGLAVARGQNALAAVDGTLGNIAVSLGAGSSALVNNGRMNAAINVASRNSSGGTTEAVVWSGDRNVAANIKTSSQNGLLLAEVRGDRSVAVNIGTTNTSSVESVTKAGSKQQPASSSRAFVKRGKDNNVQALGDQAVAGAVDQTGATVTQTGPGKNVVKTSGLGKLKPLAAGRSGG